MLPQLFCGILVVYLTLLHNNVWARTSASLKVELSHGGILVGRHLTSHKGRNVRAFMGVPYAQPPLNELRFKPPVPAVAWTGEKLAIKDSDICIQRDPFRRDEEIEGSEDCLYLNVYIPELSDDEKDNGVNTNGLLPVMVFFHGGGWECGSGISAFYGPEYLMDRNVIYVSGNFRLGPLGFLSTETTDCPGNFGLKDQVEILKWVQKNIEAFGGDPQSVTIFGESAGGASVNYHMMSKMSKGLFQKGISQSGTYFNPWSQPAHKGVASARALQLAKLLNCDTNEKNWKKIIDCLQTKPAKDITETVYKYFKWDTDPMIPFPPVIEPKHSGAFITKLPREEKLPHGLSLPWMAGVTADEGTLKTVSMLNIPGLLDDFKKQFSKVLPIILNYDHHSDAKQNQITNEIDDFYFKGEHNWSKKNHQNLTNLITDGWFMAGLDEYFRYRLSKDNTKNHRMGPTYAYLFNHKGAASFTEIFHGGREDYYGVCHAEELQYLFPIGKALFVTSVPTTHDVILREAMLEMWVNFAKFGNPTPAGSNLPEWKEATDYPVSYVQIGAKDSDSWTLLKNEHSLMQERADFWAKLKPHLPSDLVKDEL